MSVMRTLLIKTPSVEEARRFILEEIRKLEKETQARARRVWEVDLDGFHGLFDLLEDSEAGVWETHGGTAHHGFSYATTQVGAVWVREGKDLLILLRVARPTYNPGAPPVPLFPRPEHYPERLYALEVLKPERFVQVLQEHTARVEGRMRQEGFTLPREVLEGGYPVFHVEIPGKLGVLQDHRRQMAWVLVGDEAVPVGYRQFPDQQLIEASRALGLPPGYLRAAREGLVPILERTEALRLSEERRKQARRELQSRGLPIPKPLFLPQVQILGGCAVVYEHGDVEPHMYLSSPFGLHWVTPTRAQELTTTGELAEEFARAFGGEQRVWFRHFLGEADLHEVEKSRLAHHLSRI